MGHKIRICPRCGSSRLSEVRTSVSGWLVPPSYYCEDCHYSGSVYVEIDSDEAENFRAAIRDES